MKPNRDVQVEQPKIEKQTVQPTEVMNNVEMDEPEKEGIGNKFKGFLSNIFD
ncbi:MAG: cell division protein FtsA C-terminal domain-containing protein [Vagococcus sp.]